MTTTTVITKLAAQVASAILTPATLIPVSFALGTAYASAREAPTPEAESEEHDDTRTGRLDDAVPTRESTASPIEAAATGRRENVEADPSPPSVNPHQLVHTAHHARGARVGKFSADARAKVNDPRPLHHRGRVFEEADVARHNLLHPRDRWSLTETNAKAVDATVDRTGQPIQHKARYGYYNETASDATKLSTNREMHLKALRKMAAATGRDDGIVRTPRGGATGVANVEESRISEANLIECIDKEWRAANFGRVCGSRAAEGALLAAAVAAARGLVRLLRGQTTIAAEIGNVVEAGLAGAVATAVTAAVSWVGGTLLLNAIVVGVGGPIAGLAALWLFERSGLGRILNRLIRRLVTRAQCVSTRVAKRLAAAVVDRVNRHSGPVARHERLVTREMGHRVQERLVSWWRRWLGPPKTWAV